MLGVAEYLQTRWRAGAIALRMICLLSLAIVAVLSVVRLLF